MGLGPVGPRRMAGPSGRAVSHRLIGWGRGVTSEASNRAEKPQSLRLVSAGHELESSCGLGYSPALKSQTCTKLGKPRELPF